MDKYFASNRTEIADDKVNKYTVLVAVTNHSKETQNRKSLFLFKMNPLGALVILCIAMFLSVTTVHGAALASPTETESTTTSVPPPTTNAVKICHGSTPCGWAVYSPERRIIDYFMRNICVCPSDRSCQRADDDLSISAYVYRCAEKPSTTESVDGSSSSS